MVLSVRIASFTSLNLCVSIDDFCRPFPFFRPLEEVTKAVRVSFPRCRERRLDASIPTIVSSTDLPVETQ